MKTTAQFLADITANVDAWYADRIDYDAFGKRQRETWDAINKAGPNVEARVLQALREQLPSPTRAF